MSFCHAVILAQAENPSRFKLTHYPEEQVIADKLAIGDRRDKRYKAANAIENSLLASGVSATVTVDQKDDAQLNIKYALVSKAYAYHWEHQEPELNKSLSSIGFRRVTLSDGYNQFYVYSLSSW